MFFVFGALIDPVAQCLNFGVGERSGVAGFGRHELVVVARQEHAANHFASARVAGGDGSAGDGELAVVEVDLGAFGEGGTVAAETFDREDGADVLVVGRLGDDGGRFFGGGGRGGNKCADKCVDAESQGGDEATLSVAGARIVERRKHGGEERLQRAWFWMEKAARGKKVVLKNDKCGNFLSQMRMEVAQVDRTGSYGF